MPLQETKPMPEPTPLFCDRCLRELTPGQGNWYQITIQAVVDPTPPEFSQEDLQRDPRAEIVEILESLVGRSNQEIKDQIHRQLTLSLCRPCYEQWIENPTGS
jgi:hypothetical protein